MNEKDFVKICEKGITYSDIEKIFTDERHYRAMKRLPNKGKLVLFLLAIEEMSVEQIAEMLNTTKDNVFRIQSRTIKKFLRNLRKER